MEGRGAWPMTEFFASSQHWTLHSSGMFYIQQFRPPLYSRFSLLPVRVLQYVPVHSVLLTVKWTTQQCPVLWGICIILTQHQACNLPDQLESGRQLLRTVCAYLGIGEDVSTPLHTLSGMVALCASSTTRQWLEA